MAFFITEVNMNTNKIFQGKNIAQIRLSKFTLSIDFDNRLSIMLSDSLVLYLNEKKISSWHHEKYSENLEELIKLIELPVKAIGFSEEKGMTIDFGDYKLDIPKPNDDYEYLHIKSEDEGVYIY